MQLHVTPTPGSAGSSETPPTLAEVMSAWRLNPPPDRTAERVVAKIRVFSGWTTEQLKERLTSASREASRLGFLTEYPPNEWTGSTWLEAMNRAGDAAATATAIRRILAGRTDPARIGSG